MGRKSLRVNVSKTKSMQLLLDKKSSVSKVDTCCVCSKEIGCNSSQCMKCERWVHHCYFDKPQQIILLLCQDVFVCRTCLGHNCSVEEKLEF